MKSRKVERLTREHAKLANLDVNYALADGEEPSTKSGWHVDEVRSTVGFESPGEPVVGGAWEVARALVRGYEFADPKILQGVFGRDAPVLGCDMLLEGHFYGLRFYLGVRVTGVTDETRLVGDPQRVWGWHYETLEGHLEQGRLTYEVLKHLETGEVEFVVSGFSRRAPIPNPIIGLGFRIFGRWTQRRFYRACINRMVDLVAAGVAGHPLPTPQPLSADSALVLAPSDAASPPIEPVAPASSSPGAS